MWASMEIVSEAFAFHFALQLLQRWFTDRAMTEAHLGQIWLDQVKLQRCNVATRHTQHTHTYTCMEITVRV